MADAPAHTTLFAVENSRVVRREVPLAAPRAGEVVVAVAGSALGAAPGREIAGTVVATGEAATEWAGRRVVVPRVLPCGECDRCRRARAAGCRNPAPRIVSPFPTGLPRPAGAMKVADDLVAVAAHETVPARYLLSVEPPLWPAHAGLWQLAALADAVATPYHALVRAGLAPGDTLIAVGAGVRGRAAIAIARARGAHAIAVEVDAAARERALAAGARAAFDPQHFDDEKLRDAILADIAGAGLRTVELKVLETTATPGGRRRALALLGPGDTAALVAGGDAAESQAPLATVAAVEAQVVGAAACHPDLLPELAALVVRGDLDLAPLVRAVAPDAIADALDELRRGARAELPVAQF